MMGRWGLALTAGLAQTVLVALPPFLVCRGMMTLQASTCVALLALAAAAETFAGEGRVLPPAAERLPPLVVFSAVALLCGFWLAFGERLLALTPVGDVSWLGAPMLLGGIALRITAITALGTGFVSEHRAIRLHSSGLYSVLRHPSETGQCLLAAGAALLLGSWWSATWLVLVVFPLTLWRLGQEEAVLMAGLTDYRDYRRRVDGLLPLRFFFRKLSPVRE